jgi:hypothetical protein
MRDARNSLAAIALAVTTVLAASTAPDNTGNTPSPPPPAKCVKHCGGLKYNADANRNLRKNDMGHVRVDDVPGLAKTSPPPH